MDENYTNVHRAFLQAVSRFSVLGPNQALTILQSVQAKRKLFYLFKLLDEHWIFMVIVADGDGDGQAAVDDAALRTLVNEINAKMASREIEQRLNFVQYEWDNPIGEFLVLCNTFAAPG